MERTLVLPRTPKCVISAWRAVGFNFWILMSLQFNNGKALYCSNFTVADIFKSS